MSPEILKIGLNFGQLDSGSWGHVVSDISPGRYRPILGGVIGSTALEGWVKWLVVDQLPLDPPGGWDCDYLVTESQGELVTRN